MKMRHVLCIALIFASLASPIDELDSDSLSFHQKAEVTKHITDLKNKNQREADSEYQIPTDKGPTMQPQACRQALALGLQGRAGETLKRAIADLDKIKFARDDEKLQIARNACLTFVSSLAAQEEVGTFLYSPIKIRKKGDFSGRHPFAKALDGAIGPSETGEEARKICRNLMLNKLPYEATELIANLIAALKKHKEVTLVGLEKALKLAN